MASGKPVIAFARGGALETVIDSAKLRTGILFKEQSVDALVDAVQRFRGDDFDANALRTFALGFDRSVFKRCVKEYVEAKWREFVGRFPNR
jgi:glycosyltransferase involved in cell wall biosynthesis